MKGGVGGGGGVAERNMVLCPSEQNRVVYLASPVFAVSLPWSLTQLSVVVLRKLNTAELDQ